MIAVIDYGVGNLFSLCSSLKYIGADSIVTSDKNEITRADKIILPGVGAFADAKAKLDALGLASLIRTLAAEGKEIMGICLGMQLLFERSYEFGECEGLGLLTGSIVPIRNYVDSSLKVPHIGWNALNKTKESKLLRYVNAGECVYFVHSYFADGCEDSVVATAEYGHALTAAVERGNIMGCQFHPEKSGEVGMKILRAFCEEDRA